MGFVPNDKPPPLWLAVLYLAGFLWLASCISALLIIAKLRP